MTIKTNFPFKWIRLLHYLEESSTGLLPDVLLMENMKYSPTSWKVWKPKFIEKSRHSYFTKMRDDVTSYHMVEYAKKRKIWLIKNYSEEEFQKIQQELTNLVKIPSSIII